MRDGWFRGGQTDVQGEWRYSLERYRTSAKWNERPTLWILAHPRTACITCDDQVTRRLMGWCDGLATRTLTVLTLYAWTAPSLRAYVGRKHVLDSGWEERLKTQVFRAREVVAAWGDLPRELLPRAEEVLAVVAGERRAVHCLGRTRAGNPRSPLAVRGRPVLEVFREAPAAAPGPAPGPLPGAAAAPAVGE